MAQSVATYSRCNYNALAINNLPFRAHRKLFVKKNFLEIIKLFSCYNNVLADLFFQKKKIKTKGSTNYLSSDVQNEFINLNAIDINVRITKEMEEAPFITITTDTTQDIYQKLIQLSTVFRCVFIKKGKNEKSTITFRRQMEY